MNDVPVWEFDTKFYFKDLKYSQLNTINQLGILKELVTIQHILNS